MAKNWWFKFDWDDWCTDPQLSKCTLETQGFWVKCICAMHRSNVSEIAGTVDDLRRLFGILPEEVVRCAHDLKRNNAADVIFGNGEVSIRSRRLERELKLKEYNRLHVAKHRMKSACNEDVKIQSKSKSNNKNKKEEEKSVSVETRPTRNKATRLPDPFPITPEMWAWLAENHIVLDNVQTAHDEWVEYWTNCTTAKAVKPRWDLAWQKGMKKAAEWQAERRSNNGKPTSEREKSAQRGSNAIALIDELRRQGREEQAVSGRGYGLGAADAILIEPAQPY